MRPLTEEETKLFFEKLSKYIGENIRQLIDRTDGVYCFRLHRERVYYVSERIMKQVGSQFKTCFQSNILGLQVKFNIGHLVFPNFLIFQ
jgi:ribosome biogenesis protein Nip4